MAEVTGDRPGLAADWPQPLAYRPAVEADPEPAYAVGDIFPPPHPLSLPLDVCDRVQALARQAPLQRSLSGGYAACRLDLADEAEVIDRVMRANGLWWQLRLDGCTLVAKRYAPGDEHAEHQDGYGGAATRKLSATVQLSEPEDYTGGAVHVRLADQSIEVPRARGTLAVWPAWTLHGVAPVTAGERWALCAFATGPALR